MSEPRVVADIMTKNVITLLEEENLELIEEGMNRYGLRHLPVVDGDKLVGLISHRDVLRLAVSSLSRDSLHGKLDAGHRSSTFVASVMTRDVQTVRPDTPLVQAAKLLLDNKFGCLPVTEADGTLVGIVTEHDFMRAWVEHFAGSAPSGAGGGAQS